MKPGARTRPARVDGPRGRRRLIDDPLDAPAVHDHRAASRGRTGAVHDLGVGDDEIGKGGLSAAARSDAGSEQKKTATAEAGALTV